MKRRNPFAVFVLSFITLGIYDLYWLVKTKAELNAKTKVHTPSIFLLFSPILLLIIAVIVLAASNSSSSPTTSTTYLNNSITTATTNVNGGSVVGISLFALTSLITIGISFFWFFKFSKAINEYTNGKSGTGITFLLLWVLHFIGVAIVQDTFNDMLDAGAVPVPANNMGPAPTMAQPQPAMQQPSPVVAPEITEPAPAQQSEITQSTDSQNPNPAEAGNQDNSSGL